MGERAAPFSSVGSRKSLEKYSSIATLVIFRKGVFVPQVLWDRHYGSRLAHVFTDH